MQRSSLTRHGRAVFPSISRREVAVTACQLTSLLDCTSRGGVAHLSSSRTLPANNSFSPFHATYPEDLSMVTRRRYSTTLQSNANKESQEDANLKASLELLKAFFPEATEEELVAQGESTIAQYMDSTSAEKVIETVKSKVSLDYKFGRDYISLTLACQRLALCCADHESPMIQGQAKELMSRTIELLVLSKGKLGCRGSAIIFWSMAQFDLTPDKATRLRLLHQGESFQFLDYCDASALSQVLLAIQRLQLPASELESEFYQHILTGYNAEHRELLEAKENGTKVMYEPRTPPKSLWETFAETATAADLGLGLSSAVALVSRSGVATLRDAGFSPVFDALSDYDSPLNASFADDFSRNNLTTFLRTMEMIGMEPPREFWARLAHGTSLKGFVKNGKVKELSTLIYYMGRFGEPLTFGFEDGRQLSSPFWNYILSSRGFAGALGRSGSATDIAHFVSGLAWLSRHLLVGCGPESVDKLVDSVSESVLHPLRLGGLAKTIQPEDIAMLLWGMASLPRRVSVGKTESGKSGDKKKSTLPYSCTPLFTRQNLPIWLTRFAASNDPTVLSTVVWSCSRLELKLGGPFWRPLLISKEANDGPSQVVEALFNRGTPASVAGLALGLAGMKLKAEFINEHLWQPLFSSACFVHGFRSAASPPQVTALISSLAKLDVPLDDLFWNTFDSCEGLKKENMHRVRSPQVAIELVEALAEYDHSLPEEGWDSILTSPAVVGLGEEDGGTVEQVIKLKEALVKLGKV